jgi:hypothetical protein
MRRALYDCGSLPLTPGGPQLRLPVASHPSISSPVSVGVERDGAIYELFVNILSTAAFAAKGAHD